jgi:putative endonuclease
MGKRNQAVGKRGERLAAQYLENQGYIVQDRNYNTRSGEIDLIATHQDDGERSLVFIEVKTRTSVSFGFPEQAVTQHKWSHIQTAIHEYLSHQAREVDFWRLDVIAIIQTPGRKSADIKHFKNVIYSDE